MKKIWLFMLNHYVITGFISAIIFYLLIIATNCLNLYSEAKSGSTLSVIGFDLVVGILSSTTLNTIQLKKTKNNLPGFKFKKGDNV